MTCERLHDFDVEAFLSDSGSAEFDAFRMHLFDCDSCSKAVEDWTVFEEAIAEAMLQDGSERGGHPQPEQLERFARARNEMGEKAMSIQAHVNLCRSCRTELAALVNFETGFLAAIGEAPLASPVAEPLRPAIDPGTDRPDQAFVDRLRDWLGSWAGDWGFAAPAFAVALLVVLGLWLGRAVTSAPDAGDLVPQVAQEAPAPLGVEAAEPTPLVDPAPLDPFEPEQLAVATESYPLEGEQRVQPPNSVEPELDPSMRVPNTRPPAPERVAQGIPPGASGETERAPVALNPTVAPAPNPSIPAQLEAESPREEIMLAAIADLPLPDYSMPPQPGSVGWMRQFGAVRSGPATASVATRAPQDHAGLALSSAPRLWWEVSDNSEFSVEITVVDDRKLDPVAKIKVPGPVSAGLHSVDLAKRGVSLEPDVEYRWFVSLIVDADRPSRNPVGVGALRVLGPDDPRRVEASAADPSQRGHALARLGVWYDAYDFFASISESRPDLNGLTRHREHLTKAAGAGG